jgi:CheY-like chemotaxis protein
MSNSGELVEILMADDDPDDRLLAKKALDDYRMSNKIRFVEDGEELMDYLRQKGRYSEPDTAPEPGLILLDLNMPKKDGREALAEIKSDPQLRHIPVVILTTSKAEEDIFRSYDLGVNSYITKPVSFQGLAEALRMLSQYWFELVKLPSRRRRGT